MPAAATQPGRCHRNLWDLLGRETGQTATADRRVDPVLGPLEITILVRIEASDGTLLFINDTNFVAIDAEGPKQDLVVPVVAVEG